MLNVLVGRKRLQPSVVLVSELKPNNTHLSVRLLLLRRGRRGAVTDNVLPPKVAGVAEGKSLSWIFKALERA